MKNSKKNVKIFCCISFVALRIHRINSRIVVYVLFYTLHSHCSTPNRNVEYLNEIVRLEFIFLFWQTIAMSEVKAAMAVR